MSLISIHNLSVTYFLGKSNEVRALKNVSLEINAGEFVIFFGPSGCGKSTLLYTISGLERASEGEVMVGDINLATMTNAQLEAYRQTTIGMVFQAFYLIPSISVIKNVMLPQIAIGADVETRAKEAERLTEYFGVYQQRHKLPNELSGGQQQRVAISRALINNPDIIFADEPVGNLDSKSAQDVLGLIQQLSIKEKKTVILVTHDPSHLDIADKVFFMKDGEITDVKENKSIRNITREKEAGEGAGQGAAPEKTTLEHVAETFAKEGFMGEMLLEYKAKQIVSSVLTGLSQEEIADIEQYVKQLLHHGRTDRRKFEAFLEGVYTEGGMRLNPRIAKKLVTHIQDTAKEMDLIGQSTLYRDGKRDTYITRVRQLLLEEFNVHITSTDALDAIDSAIEDRIAGVTDRKGVQSQFDRSIHQGGAGLDARHARKMARHLELILVGRYAVDELPTTKKGKKK